MFPKILGQAPAIIPGLASLPPLGGAPSTGAMKPIILSKNQSIQGHTPFSGMARQSSTS